MGSSGGGTPRMPDQPTPSGTQVAYGGTSPTIPGGGVPSFLPNDPGAMATGLTPEMIASINAAPKPQPTGPPAAAAAPAGGMSIPPAAQFLMAMGAPPERLLGPDWQNKVNDRQYLSLMMSGIGRR